jgi:hypothetical protein
MSSFFEIYEILMKWSRKSYEKLEDGTELICHVPHVAPEAWFHKFYCRLKENELIEFQKQFPVEFPLSLKAFLHWHNGINFFSDSMSVWGWRDPYYNPAKYQPYDLLSLNRERPKNCKDSWLYFGGYSWDGTRVFFDTEENLIGNKVYRAARRSTEILNVWDSFEAWLHSEVIRLSELYDEHGVKQDKNIPTCPQRSI